MGTRRRKSGVQAPLQVTLVHVPAPDAGERLARAIEMLLRPPPEEGALEGKEAAPGEPDADPGC